MEYTQKYQIVYQPKSCCSFPIVWPMLSYHSMYLIILNTALITKCSTHEKCNRGCMEWISTLTHSLTHSHPQSNTLSLSHAHTHTHTLLHIHTHTHTHTVTSQCCGHIQSYSVQQHTPASNYY